MDHDPLPVEPVFHNVLGYTSDQEGQDILPQDVVRPINLRWCTIGSDEAKTWRYRNHAGSLTYGSCQSCFSSGPLGLSCRDCHAERYVIVKTGMKIVDSVTLAQLLQKGHTTAKADQYYSRKMQHVQRLNDDLLELLISKRYRHIIDNAEKKSMIRQTKADFYAMLE